MCDTIAAVSPATSGSAVLFGKNSDREYNEAQYLEWIPAKRHPKGSRVRLTYKEIDQVPVTHAILLSKPHWIWGAEIGANEHGFVIGNEALFSKIEPSTADGVIGLDYLRLALERARDVEEGISVITRLLREHGQGGNCGFKRTLAYDSSFILADRTCAKVLETVDREWVVAPVNDYYAISNNMTIGATFEASSPTIRTRAIEAGIYRDFAPFEFNSIFDDQPKIASGLHRRARAMHLLGARSGRLQLTDFFRVLRDHVEGEPQKGGATGPASAIRRICAHTRENPLAQTTASWVAMLGPAKVIHWVTGTAAPCTGLFKPVLLEAGLPDHGPHPGTDEDRESLWWRHEQLRRQLDECKPESQTAFVQERDALEARFMARMEECPPVTDDSSRAATRDLVVACWQEALAFESKWYP